MKPDARVWRKTLRAEAKGTRGRRRAKRVMTQAPRPGSTWTRRHWWRCDVHLMCNHRSRDEQVAS